MEIIEKVVVNLLNNQGVFYASLLTQMHRTSTNKIPTAGVTVRNGRIELYYNPDFLESLKTIKEQRAVLEHECMHLVMDHIPRMNDRDHKLWNIATDLAINQLIDGLPKEAVTLDKFPAGWGLQPKQNAEKYYDIIYKNADRIEYEYIEGDGKPDQNSQGGAGGQGKDQKDGKGKDGQGGEGQGPRIRVRIKDASGKVKSEFDIDAPGNHNQWKNADSGDIAKEVVKQAVKEAKEVTERSQGHTPSGLEEYIAELLAPPVIPWQVLLRRLVATKIKAGHKSSWKRPNRRFGEEQKGTLANRRIAITIAIDTSGSIGNEDFYAFMAEIRGIQKSHKADITVLECDAAVQKEYVLKPNMALDTKFKGRGGTAFEPIFKYVKDEHIYTDLLIYFTDMYGSFPPKPAYPTIWVSTTDIEQAPFGTVISIPKNDPKRKKRR